MHKLYTDGGARGNPGPAATGFLVYDQDDQLVASGSEYLGIATNNLAEYKALISGLKLALDHNVTDLSCFLDSELVVKQLKGEYRVKHPDLKPLFAEVMELRGKFERLSFTHVPRSQNKEADRLVNEELDKHVL